jgi:hypothetical protein
MDSRRQMTLCSLGGLPSLQVTADQRGLCTAAGEPFFYLGDTAWELFHRLDRAETELYLADRAAKGFTVIQAVALAELDGLRVPNRQGDCPLLEMDPLRPNKPYWQHVDWVVARANAMGLYIGMLPTWGDKWNQRWGVGPEIFTVANARPYGRWLSRRYRDAGVIWITGGDRNIESDLQRDIIHAMAEGLREGDGGAHLISYHPSGGQSSSSFVADASWLDFNMIQSGHGRNDALLRLLAQDWSRTPPRPMVNGEPAYEAHPNHFRQGDDGWLDQHDVRRELYVTICSGAAGYSYGAHPIWQFYDRGRTPVNGPRLTWQEALALPGASQLKIATALLRDKKLWRREPAAELIVQPEKQSVFPAQACWHPERTRALVYLPEGQRVTLGLKFIKGVQVGYEIINPRSGELVAKGELVGGCAQTITPPEAFDGGRDWLLYLAARP